MQISKELIWSVIQRLAQPVHAPTATVTQQGCQLPPSARIQGEVSECLGSHGLAKAQADDTDIQMASKHRHHADQAISELGQLHSYKKKKKSYAHICVYPKYPLLYM